MKDWKIIVISAALAFLFSFISGLLGQVSLGVLLIRAFLGAFIFGILGYGISVVFRRYLPELFEIKSDATSEFIEDPSEVQNNSYTGTEVDGSLTSNPLVDISIGDETSVPVSELGLDVENIQASDNNSENELVDEIEESKSADESNVNDQIPGNIDALPDMGEFSNSFDNSVNVNGGNSSSSGVVTLDIMGEEQDPELVVRAVRTMVKKDQEG